MIASIVKKKKKIRTTRWWWQCYDGNNNNCANGNEADESGRGIISSWVVVSGTSSVSNFPARCLKQRHGGRRRYPVIVCRGPNVRLTGDEIRLGRAEVRVGPTGSDGGRVGVGPTGGDAEIGLAGAEVGLAGAEIGLSDVGVGPTGAGVGRGRRRRDQVRSRDNARDHGILDVLNT